MAVADLLVRRGRSDLLPEERAEIDDRLNRAVLMLWQTNLLRQTRLDVMDEVNNSLAYFDYTFFRELPRLYAQLQDRLAAADAALEEAPLA